MKKLSITIFAVVALISCKDNSQEGREQLVSQTTEGFSSSHTSVGDGFTAKNILSVSEMSERYQKMKIGDTINVKFKAEVSSVCKNKGCWMKVDMEDGNEAMVRFKDYAFFVPKDIEKKEVIVNGKAYVSEVSIEEQRHFAEDEGKSAVEVAAIVKPKKTLSFLAEGVVIDDE